MPATRLSARFPRRTLAVPALAVLTLIGSAAIGTTAATATPAAAVAPSVLPASTLPASALPAGTGATVPFVEQQAENARTNGVVLGPDRAYGTLAAESVGRKSVRLQGTGKYVEFTLSRAANAVDLRYSIPDSADGTGLNSTISVLVNGRPSATLPVTSRYSWYYGQYPWSNTPADGGRRQQFDDSRLMFAQTLPAGTRVRFQVGPHDTAPWYVLDVADFEHVAAPAKAPHNALSVVSFGADPSGHKDSTDAIQRALDTGKAQHRPVWLPVGTFTVTRHLIVDQVSLTGAGPWYSVLHGLDVGVYGKYVADGSSSNVHLADFAIFGETTERVDADQVNGIGGALNHSPVDDVWIQHTKVGAWLDGPFDGLHMTNLRILDQTADGVNFHDGVTHSSVTNSYIRNTGDDGLAMWSENDADAHDSFAHNTVVLPILANTLAVYGGSDNTVADNLAMDTITEGGGVQIANRFNAVPLAGTTTVTGNVLLRTGSLGLFSHIGWGALWFYAGDSALTGKVDATRNVIADSSYEAVQFYGDPVSNVHLADNLIWRAGTFGVQLNTSGSADLTRTAALGLGAGAVYDCDSGFTLRTTASPGLTGSTCGYPAPGPLTVDATNLTFHTDAVGHPGDPQVVTVHNPTSRPQHIASVTTTGSYTLSTTCGSTLAAGASCTVTIAFAPTPLGDHGGALTISDGTPAGRYQVYLQGSIVASTVGNLIAGKTVTATSNVDGFPASNTADGNTDTYWESTANAFPQSLTADLGATTAVSRVAVKLTSGWSPRTETFEIQGSTDGSTFTTLVPTADYSLDPAANNNTVSIPFGSTNVRYLRVVVTGNTGWPAAQIAEFEAYA